MDLLFSRYASPFLLLDEIIEHGNLPKFIHTMYEKHAEDKLWDLYLHFLTKPLKEMSFEEFKELLVPADQEEMTEVEIKDTFKESFSLLEDFVPE